MNKKFIIVLLAIIALIALILIKFNSSKKTFIHSLSDYPPIDALNTQLLQNYENVKKEIIKLQQIPRSANVVIGKGDIYNPDKQAELINKINSEDAWTIGWDVNTQGADNWSQYPIAYKGVIFPNAKKNLPLICSFIEPIKHCFHTLFISTLKPHGVIERHCDGGDKSKLLEKDRLTYHFNVDCPPVSTLTVEDMHFVQKNRGHIVFDSAYEHGVKNESSYPRTIICAKFFMSKSKK